MTLFTHICFKRLTNVDFNSISLQLVGSIGLAENLREILTQLDESDLLIFYDAFGLPIPPQIGSADSENEASFSQKSVLIEILVNECTAGSLQQKDPSVQEITLFPTEKDFGNWKPFETDQEYEQATYTTLKEMQLAEIDKLLK